MKYQHTPAAILAVALSLSGASLTFAQSELVKDKASQGSTRFESFSAKAGSIVVKESFDLPAVDVEYGKTEVRLVRLSTVDGQGTVLAVVVKFDEGKRLGISHSSILDEDEIRSLLDAIGYMRTNGDAIVKNARAYTEFTYTSRGGFGTGFYVDREKQVGFYMNIGRETVFMKNLVSLEASMRQALAQIDTLKLAK